MHGPRPALTLALLLTAAALVMAGGAVLARRVEEVREPVDRTLLREAAASLQAELSRLDFLFLNHLTACADAAQIPGAALADRENAARGLLENLYGPESVTVLSAKNGAVLFHSAIPPRAGIRGAPPRPELTVRGARPASLFGFAVPREAVFASAASSPAAPAEGWLTRQDRDWTAWWRRAPDGGSVTVILIRRVAAFSALRAGLATAVPAAWAPVRAAGGPDRLEGPDGATLAGGSGETPDRQPDFILPLTSRLGDWQIVSWDRRVERVVLDPLLLTVSGTLSAGIALLGFMAAAGQRRALREVTARVSFVNRVSHELCAPLTNIRLSLDLAQDAVTEGRPEETERRISAAREEAARLGRLAENVLTFARRERRLRPAAAECRPAEILEEVVRQFGPALERRGIAVEKTADPEVRAVTDPDALARILANLVSNVEKYAADGKWMALEMECRPGRLVFTVRDRGPGIPEEEAERVFRPFERLDSAITDGVSGAGLGLAIARDLARKLGGGVHLLPGTAGAVFQVIILHVPPSA